MGDLEARVSHHDARIEALEKSQAIVTRHLAAIGVSLSKLSDKLDRILDAMEGDSGRREG